MRILVTGANGYIGSGIIKKILELGHEVIAVDFSLNHIDERAEKFKCDLFSVNKPYDYFGKPDILLHLAWRDGFKHNSPVHIEDLPKHNKFIENFIKSGVKQVVIMGSMHEIGFFEGRINENTPCNPENMYGIAKDALRKSVRLMCQNNFVKFLWLRGYYIVGNSEYGSSIFSKITAAEKEGKENFPFTTGQNQYDFLDYDDFCEQVARATCQSNILGIVNICSGKPEKLCDRVERFIKENKYSIKLKYGAFPDRKYDSLAVWGNNKKIKYIMDNIEKDISEKFYD
ncbi:NAD-dependent epimerase/dehydratase family protein [Clostridium perfringens]|uniref:NAD-dependent epimerase/dehydratase family protein n=1 Tax=Clostridium perfringens TaxID=1502 RepID=UPI0039EA5336